jgi:tetratricopeptide (TPR) repeat protein
LVSTRCLSYGAGLPYWPLADLLRREARIDADTPKDIALARLGEALASSPTDVAVVAAFLGIETDRETELGPEAVRRHLHGALLNWFRALASSSGLVAVIEDVHWADSSTTEVIEQVARSAEPGILLLLSARPEASEKVRALGAEELALGPLAAEHVAEVLAATLGGSPPQPLVEFVSRRAGGNPFFVEELVRALRDRGAVVSDGGRWTMKPGWDDRELPPTIEEVLAARIDLLPHRAAAVLQAAAVIGRRMRTPLLREVVGDLVDNDLEQLVESGLIDRLDDDLIEFHHALVQDVAYSRLLRRRQRKLHSRVAVAAERLYGSGDDTIDLLARHLYLAGAANASDYLLRAGRRAARLFANQEAILHLGRALELSTDDRELQLELARLHELVGDYDVALDLFTTVRDATGDVRAWRGLAATLRKRGDYERAMAETDKAFHDDRLRGSDLTPLWLEQAWTLSVAGHPTEAASVARAGLAAAGEGRTRFVGELLTQLARAESIEGDVDQAIDDGRSAHGLFDELGDAPGRALASRVLGDIYRLAGRIDEAAAALQEGLALAEKVGSAEELGGCLINLGMVELERGDAPTAISLTERAVEEFERVDHGSGRAWGYSNLAWALASSGAFEEAGSRAEQSLAFSQGIGHTITVAESLDTMAYIALETGDVSRAAATAEEAAGVFLEMGMQPKAQEALQRAADAWDRQGEGERARTMRERARSLAAV